MTRWRAVGVLVLVVGGLILLSLSTIVAGTAPAPAQYAQVSVGTRTLDIWADTATHDLTFHWDDDNSSVASRYIPKRFALAELSGGEAIDVSRYPSAAVAWDKIKTLYGVTRQNVEAALDAGNPSPAPPTGGVKVVVPNAG